MFQIFVSREKKPDFPSRMIMKKFGTQYSHIGIVHNETIYHMVGKGFSKLDLKKFKETHYIQSFKVTKLIKNRNFALGYLEGRLGVEYSQSQYLGFLFPWTRKFVKNNREKGVCSEEVARFLILCCKEEVSKWYKEMIDDLDFVSPKDVWEELKNYVD